jgi:hypothetical protein
MTFPAQRTAYLSLVALVASALVACDKNDYTTWDCTEGADQTKISMVLSRSRMTFTPPQALTSGSSTSSSSDLRFCGSLGHHSYFDLRCPADTPSAAVRFTPGSGELRLGSKTLQCTVL